MAEIQPGLGFGNLAGGVGFLAFPLNCVPGDVPVWEIAGEKPVPGYSKG